VCESVRACLCVCVRVWAPVGVGVFVCVGACVRACVCVWRVRRRNNARTAMKTRSYFRHHCPSSNSYCQSRTHRCLHRARSHEHSLTRACGGRSRGGRGSRERVRMGFARALRSFARDRLGHVKLVQQPSGGRASLPCGRDPVLCACLPTRPRPWGTSTERSSRPERHASAY